MSEGKGSLKEAELGNQAVNGDAASDIDNAWQFLQENRDVTESSATEQELSALRRKIDWHIVPIMFCCYTMQFLDKVILNVSQGPALLSIFFFLKSACVRF